MEFRYKTTKAANYTQLLNQLTLAITLHSPDTVTEHLTAHDIVILFICRTSHSSL